MFNDDGSASPPWSGFDYYGDLYNSLGTTQDIRIRGRLIHDELREPDRLTTPMKQISQDEAKRHRFTLWHQRALLGNFSTDSEGYFDERIHIEHLGLRPGEHEVDLRVDNVHCGVCRATLLDPGYSGYVLRSDIDLTYLATDFQSATAVAELLFQTSQERRTLPGMEALFQELALPTVFLSGSPKFFKRVLEAKMALDGVDNAGLVLKPYKELVVRGIFRPASIAAALKEQIGFKLARLLRMRVDIPSGSKEILLGDDSEADHVVYYLYDRLLRCELTIDALMQSLKGLGVAKQWRKLIQTQAPLVLDSLPGSSGHNIAPIAGIFIRKTAVPNAQLPVAQWSIPGRTIQHRSTADLANALHETGLVSYEVYARLLSRLEDNDCT